MKIELECDREDYDTIQSEFARRQAGPRDEHGTTLPEGGSNLAGAMVAEMVRDLIEYRSMFDTDRRAK